jgi:hypothetical protein
MQQSHYKHLSDKWRVRHQNVQKRLWNKHGESLGWLSSNFRQLISGSLGGLMLLTGQLSNSLPVSHAAKIQVPVERKIDNKVFLISDLAKILPEDIRALNADEEKDICDILSRAYGIKVAPELEEKKLNRSYGLIGAEQHLALFPGDNLSSHFGSDEDGKLYWQQGMAPGLGAWRYFASSKEELTKADIDREKYYIAVPTFLSKDFKSKFAEYRDFYKYRKMLVVNPNNGRAIVADIADAGPAEWTGKHLGGSPEVMHYLERFDGNQKGAVLYFFIDDPDDRIKLGPIQSLSSI